MDTGVAGEVSCEQASLGACILAAVQRGTFRTMRDGVEDEDRADDGTQLPPPEAGAVELDGFNLHAGVAIEGDDDHSRERLMRYGARPPLALDACAACPTDGSLTGSRSCAAAAPSIG
jgi:hypothetical protein